MLALGASVLALDFNGCGMSTGEYVSLGAFEKGRKGVYLEGGVWVGRHRGGRVGWLNEFLLFPRRFEGGG